MARATGATMYPSSGCKSLKVYLSTLQPRSLCQGIIGKVFRVLQSMQTAHGA